MSRAVKRCMVRPFRTVPIAGAAGAVTTQDAPVLHSLHKGK